MTTRTGICRICLNYGPLSFEHIPPESCFNNESIQFFRGDQAVKFHFNGKARYTPFQRGHGEYTICAKCNNSTGQWYGSDYAEFIGRIGSIYDRLYLNGQMTWHFNIRPLRIIKQILSMMLSVNDFSDFEEARILRNLVLDKESIGMPSNVRLYICVDRGNVSRFIGNAAMLSLDGESVQLSDMAFWPLGITMCLDGELPDRNMLEISHWSMYSYNESADLMLDIPVLNSFSPYPGVYLSNKTYGKMISKGHHC